MIEAQQEKARTEVRASLVVRGFSCDHSVVTEALGAEPTECWQPREPIRHSALKRTDKGWRLASNLSKEATVEEHAQHLLRQVDADAGSKIKPLPTTKVRLVIAIYIYGHNRPPIALSDTTIRRLAELNASFDVDLYCL